MNLALKLTLIPTSAAAVWLACAPIDVQPFIAGQYIPSLDCVTPGEAIDVIAGLATDASCDATCIVPPYEAGVYVTGACAPFPPGDFVNPDNPECTKAIAAIHRSDLCLEAGPSNPAHDSGVDAAGKADAAGTIEASTPRDAAHEARTH